MAKDSCSYHSAQPAVWLCDECCKDYCGDCIVVIDEPAPPPNPRCPLCENKLSFLGQANNAKPFWTVAPMFFGYPLSGSGLALIGFAAVLGLFLLAGIFGLVVFFVLCAVVVRYGLAVLSHVAQGKEGSPSFNEAIAKDEDNLFLKFVVLLVGMVVVELAVSWLVSPGLGAAVSLLFSLLLPAMIIYLAVERSISSAVVPTKLIWLITQIGWPYLLVVFISNVLSTGPIFVLSVIGSEVSAFFLLPMLAASFAYFTVVNFAMLGYLIFENQGALGYVAGDIDDVAVRNSTDNRLKCLLGEVNVLVKESRHADALKRINLSKSEFRDHPMFFERAVLLALSVKDKNLIESLTDGHLKLLVDKDALDQALDCFRRSIVVHKDFRPSEPDIAHALAEHAYGKNLNKEALTLLINLHQRAPHYDRLGDAYRLAATIMRVGFNNEAKALELENFVAAKGYG